MYNTRGVRVSGPLAAAATNSRFAVWGAPPKVVRLVGGMKKKETK